MAPPSASHEHETETGASIPSNGHDKPQKRTAPLEPGLTETQAASKALQSVFPSPPKFADKYQERAYQKGRLALAFRIFAKFGFDEGVAGHITLRVSLHTSRLIDFLGLWGAVASGLMEEE